MGWRRCLGHVHHYIYSVLILHAAANEQLVTYRIGKAYNKIWYFHSSTKHNRKVFGSSQAQHQKNVMFSCRGKTKCNQKNSNAPPPPRISNGVSLIQNNLFICIYLNLHFGTPENVLCDGLLSLLCSHIILLTYIDLKINWVILTQ